LKRWGKIIILKWKKRKIFYSVKKKWNEKKHHFYS
jgi:hypothetical protein